MLVYTPKGDDWGSPFEETQVIPWDIPSHRGSTFHGTENAEDGTNQSYINQL